MCNLSQGIKEAGIAVGEKRGMEKGIAEGIRATVEICQEDGKTLDSTSMRIKEKFSLSQEDAIRYVKRFLAFFKNVCFHHSLSYPALRL